MTFVIEETDRSLRSASPGEDLDYGEVAFYDPSTDNVRKFQYSDFGTDDRRHDGYVADPETAESVEYSHDVPTNYTTYDYGTYDSTEVSLVPYGGGADGDVVNARTIDDSNVDISRGDVVGVIDTSAGAGRVVQEGVTIDATTYDRASGNFYAVGEAEDSEADADSYVKVRNRSNLN